MHSLTDLAVTAPDGVMLATDVHLPDGEGPWPAVLMRTGYGKDGELVGPNLALTNQGCAVVLQDVRGLGASGGRHDLTADDGTDGAATIGWITEQPWSDGRVAMIGASYLGLTQWQAAAQAPAGLVAIAPTISGGVHDGYGFHSPGVVQLDMLIAWVIGCVLEDAEVRTGVRCVQPLVRAAAEATRNATDATSRLFELLRLGRFDDLGPAMAELGESTEARNAAFETLWAEVPLPDLVTAVADVLPWVVDWVRHADPADPYWTSRDHQRALGDVRLPTLQVGGWNDVFIRGTLRQFTAVAGNGARHRLVIHPFGHTGPGRIGDVALDLPKYPDPWIFGGSVNAPAPDLGAAFFAEHLGTPAPAGGGPTAPISIYVMGADEWRDEHEWPLARTVTQRLHLDRRGGRGSDGLLVSGRPEQLGKQHPDTFVYDPSDPVPTRGGTTMGFGRQPGQVDQSDVESRPDVLVFTTDLLPEPVEVTGHPRVRLLVSTTAADTDFTARLTDVDEDGRSLGITDGVVRLRFRPGATGTVEPGSVQEAEIELSPTSYLFAAGHRIRLQVSSSNFPLFDPNPNTGGSLLLGDNPVAAVQTVFHDSTRPSYVELPTIPRG